MSRKSGGPAIPVRTATRRRLRPAFRIRISSGRENSAVAVVGAVAAGRCNRAPARGAALHQGATPHDSAIAAIKAPLLWHNKAFPRLLSA